MLPAAPTLIESPLRRLPRWPRPALSLGLVLLALTLIAPRPVRAQEALDLPLPGVPPAFEPMSPEGITPASASPGLTERAIPTLATPEEDTGYVPLYRLTRPYYDTLFRSEMPAYQFAPDPIMFREVLSYEPPIALRPRIYKNELLEITPYVGLSQTYDSNVNLTPTNQISDFYITPRFGIEFQLGTPDSAYISMYDTILAAHASYEGFADLFFENPSLSAYNQKFDFTARIGRSSAIWRPFVFGSDTTGTNLLTRDLTNRTERFRLLAGATEEYKLTELTGLNHTMSHFTFDHADSQYINLEVIRSQQELTYRFAPDLKALIFTEYRGSNPDRGFSANENYVGFGWAGKFDPRLYSEMRIGYDFLSTGGYVPGRRPMSGLRFNGYTTFQWSPRTALTFRYNRDYVFNEITPNDNYLSTILELKLEFYLGENWFITPYMGVGLDEFETSHTKTLNMTPEIEVAYAFPNRYRSNESRIYMKVAYQRSDPVEGGGQSLDGVRISFGSLVKF